MTHVEQTPVTRNMKYVSAARTYDARCTERF